MLNDFQDLFNYACLLSLKFGQISLRSSQESMELNLLKFSGFSGFRDISHFVLIFLTVCDKSVMTYIEKFRFLKLKKILT